MRAGLQHSLHHIHILGSSAFLAPTPDTSRSHRLCFCPSRLKVKYCSLDMRCRFPKSCLERLFDSNQSVDIPSIMEGDICVHLPNWSQVCNLSTCICLSPSLVNVSFSLTLTTLETHSGLSLIWMFCHTIYFLECLDRLRHLDPKINYSKE